MTGSQYRPGLVAAAALLAFGAVCGLVVVTLRLRPDTTVVTVTDAVVEEERGDAVTRHAAKPERVKAIYLTTASAVGAKYQEMLALADRTEINALAVDLKDDSGAPGFRIVHPDYADISREKPTIPDLAAVAADAHAHGLYLIARLPVFQDSWFADRHPELAMGRRGGGLWRDRRGIRWLDPAAQGVWEYNAVLAEEAHAAGFDEIQFDYVRFASDGDISTITYPAWDRVESKPEVMERFFAYMDDRLRAQGIPLSADLFGYTFRVEDGYDLGIGQRLALVLPYVDFVSPMVYPSHYPSGHLGLANPAASPGVVVDDALADGQTIIDAVRPDFRGVRPWLQDFDLGADYTAAMVRQQIDAAEKRGAEGWLLWNARNVYTEAALKKE
ncbi:GTP-binding protein [Patescibacteria group bacterium]|nr:MAG: GTP-binding protein [Patescibacteria group bacterium]